MIIAYEIQFFFAIHTNHYDDKNEHRATVTVIINTYKPHKDVVYSYSQICIHYVRTCVYKYKIISHFKLTNQPHDCCLCMRET